MDKFILFFLMCALISAAPHLDKGFAALMGWISILAAFVFMGCEWYLSRLKKKHLDNEPVVLRHHYRRDRDDSRE